MDNKLVELYLQGNGIEISPTKEFHVLDHIEECEYTEDDNLSDSTDEYNWVYSGSLPSKESIREWIRVVKLGGYIVLWIPGGQGVSEQHLFQAFSKSKKTDLIKVITQEDGYHVVLQKKLRFGNILIVTAHLDDFVVWSSNLIQKVNARFLVISAITGTKQYKVEFDKVIKKLQEDGIEIDGLSLGMKSTRVGHLDHNEMKRRLLSTLAEWSFVPNMILTHNRVGEYGHQNHKDVHLVVHELFKTNVMDFDRESYFQPVPKKAYGSKLDLLRIFKSQTEGFLLR